MLDTLLTTDAGRKFLLDSGLTVFVLWVVGKAITAGLVYLTQRERTDVLTNERFFTIFQTLLSDFKKTLDNHAVALSALTQEITEQRQQTVASFEELRNTMSMFHLRLERVEDNADPADAPIRRPRLDNETPGKNV